MRGFVWSARRGFLLLPYLQPNDTQSAALDLNDHGVIVGFSGAGELYRRLTGNTGQDAFFPVAARWQRSARNYSAHALGPVHSVAYHVNRGGSILIGAISTETPAECFDEDGNPEECYPSDFTTETHTLMKSDGTKMQLWKVEGYEAKLEPLGAGSRALLLDDNWALIAGDWYDDRPLVLSDGTSSIVLGMDASEQVFAPASPAGSHRNFVFAGATKWNGASNLPHTDYDLFRIRNGRLVHEETLGCLPTAAALTALGAKPWTLSAAYISSSRRIVLNYTLRRGGKGSIVLQKNVVTGALGSNLCTSLRVSPVGQCAEHTFQSNADSGDVSIFTKGYSDCSLSVEVLRLADTKPLAGAPVEYVREDPAIGETVVLASTTTSLSTKSVRIKFAIPQFDRRTFKLLGVPHHPVLLGSQAKLWFNNY